MLNNKTILAIIPARSGSKGLKDKNIKLLASKPLIAYTIEAAIESKVFADIVVSTDSTQYADIVKTCGAQVPFLRPSELGQDQSSSTDVILHTIESLEKLGKHYDYFMLLQPTSPLRSAQSIRECVQLMVEKSANAIVSVCEANHSKELMLYLDEEKCLDGFLQGVASQRQKQKVTYTLNGAIYLSNIEYFKKNKNFYKEKCYAYMMDKYESVDIDDIYDFKYAQVLMEMKGDIK